MKQPMASNVLRLLNRRRWRLSHNVAVARDRRCANDFYAPILDRKSYLTQMIIAPAKARMEGLHNSELLQRLLYRSRVLSWRAYCSQEEINAGLRQFVGANRRHGSFARDYLGAWPTNCPASPNQQAVDALAAGVISADNRVRIPDHALFGGEAPGFEQTDQIMNGST